MGKMTKSEFISAVAEKAEVSKKEVSAVYEAIVDVVTEQLIDGNKIALVGFGNFETRDRAATTGVNPSTGEKINIPAKRVPKFSFSSTIKAKVDA